MQEGTGACAAGNTQFGAPSLWGMGWPAHAAPPARPRALRCACRYPALIGSIAVAAGYFLKIDALGNLHWNSHDALLGLQVRVCRRQLPAGRTALPTQHSPV